ncbi:MAG: CHAT domain-containing protein [Bacteroidota bacterium]|nr:CHAT domain-containing protein [Bacteroidota bacterium]
MRVQNMVIKGTEQTVPVNESSAEDIITLRKSYTIGGSVRGLTETHDVPLEKDDLVELVFNDDTTWYCNTDTIDEVFPGASKVNRSGDPVFEVPVALVSTDVERGIAGSILLKGLNIFAKKTIDKKVHDVAADFEKKQLENTSGLYRLDENFQLQPFTPSLTNTHYLLFLHGTASSTKSSFGELVNTDLWKYIHDTYGANVLAFQHESLTKSPLQNVLDMVKQLPQNISFDIISHSRGGLVGDTLARFCNTNENIKGFDDNEIEYLKKADNRKNDLDNIDAIKAELANKKIIVNKFIRVACPAQGTTLASNRMDHFFNVTFNLIGMAGGLIASPVYNAFKNLISTVIDCKNEVDVLPGLEAMNPDSPFIKVLNSPASNVILDQPLLVVSGNCQTKLNLKALLIIVSKLFYLKDNDLVVNTKSMYYGSKRQAQVQYLFDDATDVDHFHYFKNKKTNDGIMTALKSTGTALVTGFSFLQQDSLNATDRNVLLNLDGGAVFSNTVTGTKPIVVLLPGIMGSNLSDSEHPIWINYLKFLSGGLEKLDIKYTNIKASSIIKTSYEKLVKFLSSEYDVVTFPFDWRLQLNKGAALFNNKINELLAYHQPIKIIGHSMGGVLVRDFIINYDETWKKLNASTGFKLVFLGAPLGGSFRIPAVLMGKDSIIDKLSKIDIIHTKKDLLGMFSKMPGLLSLLPLTTDSDNNFAANDTWTKMSEPLGKWPLPQPADLKEFEKYRDNILASMDNINYSNIIYIAGKDPSTPCGYRVDETNRGKELILLSTAEGDQSVTWESGIPKKMIENNSVYYVNVSHGSLANEPTIFRGIADIIATGSTITLSKTRPEIRGAEKTFVTPQHQDFDISSEGVTKTLLGLDSPMPETTEETPLRVSVSNGDLRYAAGPILAGHFWNDGILNAEKQIDQNMGFALSEMHKLSIYPGDIGSSEIFGKNKNDFNGAIIVGLGETGFFTAYQLTQTVEQGVCKFLLNECRKDGGGNLKGKDGAILISSLIIGSGYGGLSIENSIRAIMQGVQNANRKIKKIRPETYKSVQLLEFVELYEDAALSCFYSLNKIAGEENTFLNIKKNIPKMRILLGSKKRIQSQTTDGWWNRVTVQYEKKENDTSKVNNLLFNASTGGAKEIQRRLKSNPQIIEKIIEDISAKNMWSHELARTIFELMIPNDFKEQLSRQCNINWILDKNTASYPWELLQDKSADAKPLCINAGMIRQLATQDDRGIINTVSKNNALVVGDPFLDGYVVQLPGAYNEAEMVSAALKDNSFQTTLILRGSSPDIIKALFSDDYKIIHLAGHGMFNPDDPLTSGMVIGNGVYLTTAELAQMSMTPDLVFVNCCFLGKTEGVAEELYRSRYKLAANIGTQLIENGVKAVVVAGWAVDDAAAMDFTKIFYENMLEGSGFGDAVQKARKTIYDKYHTVNNTWGAYQCYGDPFYKFDNRQKQNKKFAPEYVIAEEAEIALHNLHNEIDLGNYDETDLLERLTAIAQAVDNAGLRNAEITEEEAFIYSDMYHYDMAVSKFQAVMAMEKADFSVRTLEKYCNVRAKKYVNDLMNGGNRSKLLKEMSEVITGLHMLLDISVTSERLSLLGSTHKRKAFISSKVEQKITDLAAAAYFYMKANTSPANNNDAYALSNWLEIESLLVLLGNRKWGSNISYGKEKYSLPSADEVSLQLQNIKDSLKPDIGNMDYWFLLQRVNVDLCRLITDPVCNDEDAPWDDVLFSYRSTWAKAGSKGNRLAEIEHLELLTDALSQAKKRDAVKLKKRIENLKVELKKLIPEA